MSQLQIGWRHDQTHTAKSTVSHQSHCICLCRRCHAVVSLSLFHKLACAHNYPWHRNQCEQLYLWLNVPVYWQKRHETLQMPHHITESNYSMRTEPHVRKILTYNSYHHELYSMLNVKYAKLETVPQIVEWIFRVCTHACHFGLMLPTTPCSRCNLWFNASFCREYFWPEYANEDKCLVNTLQVCVVLY